MPNDNLNQINWLSLKATFLFAILLLCTMSLQVGCWSEVAYEPVAQNDSESDANGEAAPFEQQENTEAPAYTPETTTTIENKSPSEKEPTSEADSVSEMVKETPKPTPPWMRNDNQPSELSEDAARYFGGTDDNNGTNESPSIEELAEEESEDDFDDLISMLEETEIASSSATKTKQKPKPETPPVNLPTAKPVKPMPSSESLVGSRNGSISPIESEPLKYNIPKTPREQSAPRQEPAVESIQETESLAGSRYADTETKPRDRLPWEIDEPTSDATSPEEESKPELIASEPMIEKEPIEPPNQVVALEPKQPTFAEEAPPKLASLEPLPSVPVLSYNTQHLAWLLGGKLGLAHLAASEGATQDEVAVWIKETEVLSNKLEIPLPQLASGGQEIAAQVTTLLDAAARTGEDLQLKHGVNHAALLEISLKTNALLVLSEKHPELAPAIAKAVEEAAIRAELPKFLWRDMHQALVDGATPDEIFEAVSEMHDNVESYLR